MKFFRSGFQRVLVDTDRALKNDISESLKAFIGDQKLTFTDKQFIRALLILQRGTGDFKAVREKDRIVHYLLNNILASKFEFKKGNTIAALTEALGANFDNLFPGAQGKTQYEVHSIGSQMVIGGTSDVMQTGSFTQPAEIYSKTVRVMGTKIIPFVRAHYFGEMGKEGKSISGGYHAYKKAVIISLLTRLKVYDESLYTNFAQHINLILNQSHAIAKVTYKDAPEAFSMFEKSLASIVCTQDPITNHEVDRFYEVVEALDFHVQELQSLYGFRKISINRDITEGNIEKILEVIQQRIKKHGKQTLLDPFPQQGHRFRIKL